MNSGILLESLESFDPLSPSGSQSIFSIVLGILLCLGGMISYFPQYYSLVKAKQATGISEFSLLLLNIGSACLTANSFILNWWKFECYEHYNFWYCTGNLLSLFQIMIGWLMVFPLYLIFIRYKIKTSERKIIHDIAYVVIYVLFILVIIIVGLAEKLSSKNSNEFFVISAKILGVVSAICSSIVWLPQIVKLLRTKQQGNLSLLMFIMQTPGNCIVILFQVLYHQDWTTWITYVITFVEQSTIVVILIVFMCRDRASIDPSPTYNNEDNNTIDLDNDDNINDTENVDENE